MINYSRCHWFFFFFSQHLNQIPNKYMIVSMRDINNFVFVIDILTIKIVYAGLPLGAEARKIPSRCRSNNDCKARPGLFCECLSGECECGNSLGVLFTKGFP